MSSIRHGREQLPADVIHAPMASFTHGTYAQPCTSEDPDHPGLRCALVTHNSDHYALGHTWSGRSSS